jgi:hypothetical protein
VIAMRQRKHLSRRPHPRSVFGSNTRPRSVFGSNTRETRELVPNSEPEPTEERATLERESPDHETRERASPDHGPRERASPDHGPRERASPDRESTPVPSPSRPPKVRTTPGVPRRASPALPTTGPRGSTSLLSRSKHRVLTALVRVEGQEVLVVQVKSTLVADAFEAQLAISAIELTCGKPVVLWAHEPCGCRDLYGRREHIRAIDAIAEENLDWAFVEIDFANPAVSREMFN